MTALLPKFGSRPGGTFHHQVTAAFPEIARRDYGDRDLRWRDDAHAAELWRRGETPIVDAGMRQLLAEGWMHSRARLITRRS